MRDTSITCLRDLALIPLSPLRRDRIEASRSNLVVVVVMVKIAGSHIYRHRL